MPAKPQNLPRPEERAYRWNDLQVLLALVRHGTLSGAAKELEVNASTISRRLDALERALGVHLFDRGPDGVLATAAAELLVEPAKEVERAARRVGSQLGSLEDVPEGVVRLTAPPGVVDQLLVEDLPPLLERFPRLQLEIDSSVAYADLTRREADVAVRVSRPRRGDLVAKRLGRSVAVPIGATSRFGGLPRVRDLDALPWVDWGDELSHLPEAAWIARHVAPASVRVRTSSATTQVAAVTAGLGVALLPRVYADDARLHEIPLGARLARSLSPFPETELWIVGHRALRNVPRVQVVWNHIVESFRRRARWSSDGTSRDGRG